MCLGKFVTCVLPFLKKMQVFIMTLVIIPVSLFIMLLVHYYVVIFHFNFLEMTYFTQEI